MKRTTIVLAVAALLLLAGSVLALPMASDNYRLDWYVVLTGGGGPTGSTNYAANFTIGQTASSLASSANYEAGLGYRYGTAGGHKIHLPLVMRAFS
jgi:hypothetical protein